MPDFLMRIVCHIGLPDETLAKPVQRCTDCPPRTNCGIIWAQMQKGSIDYARQSR